jgi:hypothetical protein
MLHASKQAEVTSGQIKLQSNETHNFYSSPLYSFSVAHTGKLNPM